MKLAAIQILEKKECEHRYNTLRSAANLWVTRSCFRSCGAFCRAPDRNHAGFCGSFSEGCRARCLFRREPCGTIRCHSPGRRIAIWLWARHRPMSLAPLWSLIYPSLNSKIKGLPLPSVTAWSFEFRPPFVRAIRRGTALFKQARRCAVSFGMSGVDNETVWLSRSACEVRKNAVEDTHPAPANKPVVQSLMGTILPWCVSPAKPVLDHDDRQRAARRERSENMAWCVRGGRLTTKANRSWQGLPAMTVNLIWNPLGI